MLLKKRLVDVNISEDLYIKLALNSDKENMSVSKFASKLLKQFLKDVKKGKIDLDEFFKEIKQKQIEENSKTLISDIVNDD